MEKLAQKYIINSILKKVYGPDFDGNVYYYFMNALLKREYDDVKEIEKDFGVKAEKESDGTYSFSSVKKEGEMFLEIGKRVLWLLIDDGDWETMFWIVRHMAEDIQDYVIEKGKK